MKNAYLLVFRKAGTITRLEVRADKKNADRLKRQLIADKEITDFIFTPWNYADQITEN